MAAEVALEASEAARALSEQLGLYRESELRDEKALMTVREQHRSLLETQQELQIAVQRWSHHTPSATAELVQVLRGALFGTLNRAGAGPTAQGAQDGAMQSEDYEDGGVLTALRRRWTAVGGFVGLAAEAAQPPPLASAARAPLTCRAAAGLQGGRLQLAARRAALRRRRPARADDARRRPHAGMWHCRQLLPRPSCFAEHVERIGRKW